MDKDDLDTCLRFHKDLSTKIFEVANTRYQNFRINVQTTTIISGRKRPSSAAVAAMSYQRTSISVEDIELGLADIDTAKSNNDVPSDVLSTDIRHQIPWFKYPLYFTISHHSYFVKILKFFSNLFNIILCIIIPYEVCMNIDTQYLYRSNSIYCRPSTMSDIFQSER